MSLAGLLVVASVLIALEVPGYRSGAAGEPGPAAVPALVAVLCSVCAIAVIVQVLRGRAHGSGTPTLSRRLGGAVVAMVVGGVLLQTLGFMVAFALVLFAMGLIAGSKKWWVSLVVAVAASWVLLLLFVRVFDVPFPLGPLDRLLGA